MWNVDIKVSHKHHEICTVIEFSSINFDVKKTYFSADEQLVNNYLIYQVYLYFDFQWFWKSL